MSTTLDSPQPATRTSPQTHTVLDTIFKVLKPIASLQLTVVLFSLSIVLVFFGTLAQIDKGIWTVVDQYFRSWYVWIPFQLIAEFGKRFFEFPQDTTWGGSFPFPGGWLLGGIMLANLFAAHIVRFKLSWRRAGIITIHAGVIIMMFGELITGLYAVESRMVLQTGESSDFVDDARKTELAFTVQAGDKSNTVVTIPQGKLMAGGRIALTELPFDILVSDYQKNTKLIPLSGNGDVNELVRVDGVRYAVVAAAEGPGVRSEREDAAAAYIKIVKRGTDDVLLERQLSLWQYDNFTNRVYFSRPVNVEADGKTFNVQLRNARIYQPYRIELLKFEHKQYAGTSTPKDFASTVRLKDAEQGEERDVRIWMNHPLRHRGKTYYQASVVYGDTGTVLQVVENPGWLMPYISCAVVALGMMVHFGMNLLKFVSRRAVV